MVLTTGSRTPLVALGATTLWLSILRAERLRFGVLLCCAIGGSLAVFYPEVLTQRGSSYRPEIWSEALNQIRDKPWFGHGMGHSVIIKIAAVNEAFADPHNIQLAVLLSGGLIGWILWIAMYAIALGYTLRHRHNTVVCRISALLIFGLIATMTEGGSYLSRPKEHWFVIWIGLAMLSGIWIARAQAVNEASACAGKLATS